MEKPLGYMEWDSVTPFPFLVFVLVVEKGLRV